MSESHQKRFFDKPKHICIDCGKLIRSHNKKVKRCKKCWVKSITGKNHPSYKPIKKKRAKKRDIEKGYSSLFISEFKKEIFERDDWTCQICGKRGGKLHCHHINYNKRDSSRNNLVTLCNSCHTRTNHNRGYWRSILNKEQRWYSLFIGRFQCIPPHEGHIKLIRTILDEGGNACIALMKEDGTEKNPYSIHERLIAFEKIFEKEIKEGRVIVIDIPPVENICYGRDVGWGIRQIRFDDEIEKISATEIRKKRKKKKDETI